MSTVDEAMSRYAQGEATAFAVVYDEVAPRLERFLRRHVREKAAVEDIVQQTFLQMHSARGTFIIGAEVMPWAFAIARRLMIDSGRKLRREESFEMDGEELAARMATSSSAAAAPTGGAVAPSGEEMLHAEEARVRLAAAFVGLSEPQRTAFELVKAEGLSHAEAATILGTTVTGIKLRVHRAYVALRSALGEPALAAAAGVRTARGGGGGVGGGGRISRAKLSPAEERR